MLGQNTHSPIHECLENGLCMQPRPQGGRHDIKPNQINRGRNMELRKACSTDSLCLSFIDNCDPLLFDGISNRGRLAVVERVDIIAQYSTPECSYRMVVFLDFDVTNLARSRSITNR